MQIYIEPETGELLEQPPEGVNTIPAKPAGATVEEMTPTFGKLSSSALSRSK